MEFMTFNANVIWLVVGIHREVSLTHFSVIIMTSSSDVACLQPPHRRYRNQRNTPRLLHQKFINDQTKSNQIYHLKSLNAQIKRKRYRGRSTHTPR